MPPLVETKILFRLELGYAHDAEFPLCISIQCGYTDCEQSMDAPEGTPILCVPMEDNGPNAWNAALTQAYDHLMEHQANHETHNRIEASTI